MVRTKVLDALRCRTCRRYRLGLLAVLVLAMATWLLPLVLPLVPQ